MAQATNYQVGACVLTMLFFWTVSSTAAQTTEEKRTASGSSVNLAEVRDFWNETLKKASVEPLSATAEIINLPVPFKKYRVTYRSLGGVMVRAYLAVPIMGEFAGQKQLPAIISTVGYSGVFPSEMLEECRRGYVILQVFPRSQGESADFWKIDGPDKLTWHIAQPDGYYYQGAYVDVLRGIDFLTSRPEVDAGRIGLMGTSQAGGIGLAVAALDSRIRAVTVAQPFLCDMRHAATIQGSLINSLLEKYGVLNQQSLRTLEFFDPLNLVDHLRRPVLMSAGGKDSTCPMQTIRAVFERLPGIKAIIVYPELAHVPSVSFEEMSWEWMDRYLRR